MRPVMSCMEPDAVVEGERPRVCCGSGIETSTFIKLAPASIPFQQAAGEAEAVAASLKATSQSIQAVKAEAAAAGEGSVAAQQQAAGTSDAVAALEQQVRLEGVAHHKLCPTAPPLEARVSS